MSGSVAGSGSTVSFWGRRERRRVALNTGANGMAKALTLGLGLVLTPVILGALGPEMFGLWALVSSLVAYGALFDLGLAGAVVRSVALYDAGGDDQAAREVISTATVVFALLGLGAFLVVAALAPWVPVVFGLAQEDAATAIALTVLMGLSLGLSLAFATPLAVLRGLHRYDLGAALGIGGSLASASATLLALWAGGGVVGMVAAGIPVLIGTQVAAMVVVRRTAARLTFAPSAVRRSRVGELLRFSWPLFAIDVAARLQGRTDEIVVGTFRPLADVTPYALSLRLASVPRMAAEQFATIIVPMAAAEGRNGNSHRLRGLLLTATRTTLALFVPLAAVIALDAEAILSAWVGDAYRDGALLVRILALTMLFDIVLWPAGFVLQGLNRHHRLAGVALASGVTNVGLSILLIGPLGLAGVALGSLVPTALESVVIVLPFALRVVGMRGVEFLREAVLPALLPLVPLIAVLAVARTVDPTPGLLGLALSSGAAGLAYLAVFLRLPQASTERAMARDAWNAARGGRANTPTA